MKHYPEPRNESVRRGGNAASPLVFYEDCFVFNTVSGLFYRLNPTAAFVLRAMADGTRPHQLPDLLQSHYTIDHTTAVRDAELFINELVSLGLCEEDAE